MAYKEPEMQKPKLQSFSEAAPKAEKRAENTAIPTMSLIPKKSESAVTFKGDSAQAIAKQMQQLYLPLDNRIKMARNETNQV